jgi:2',3'-cyclic-nucleotide 2'-phosphodiesterase (5'-nucleotidase family)
MSGNVAKDLSPFIRIMIAIFLLLLAVWIVLKIYIARTESPEPPADGTKISVFVTAGLGGYREPRGSEADTYSGMAQWASLIDMRRRQNPAILVDAGDFCDPAWEAGAEAEAGYFFEAMGLIGYTAAGIGSGEILFGRERLYEMADRAGFELLSANIRGGRGEEMPGSKHTVIRAGGRRTLTGMKGGVRIGVFSVALRELIPGVDFDILDPRIAALEAVSILKEKGCDLILALSYQGWEESLSLAESVDGIDIVINGLSGHDRLTEKRIGNTMVVDTGPGRSSLTELRVLWSGGNPAVTVVDPVPAAGRLSGREDLVDLEERYRRELGGDDPIR